MAITLTVVSEAHRGRQIAVTVPEFRIGRDPQCHLRPASTDVSREHCAIVVKQGRVFLRDYGSQNGTILNRRMLVHGELQLEDNDLIEIGPLAFRIHLGPAAAAPAAPRPESRGDIFDDDLAVQALLEDHELSPGETVVVSRHQLPQTVPQSPDDAGVALCD